MKMNDFRRIRGMAFVKRGMRVTHTHNGKSGRISGANSNANLNVIFDGEKRIHNCHPTWKMKYFDDEGNVIADYC